MRNLKRALSLTLASVMLLGMMVVGSSALSFNDADDITNVTAASVLEDLGIMQGDGSGNFMPDRPVTRAQMAIIICRILYGNKLNVSQFEGTTQYTDVAATEYYTGYINLATQLGIIGGYGDGRFGPNDTVTTAQAALMLSRALGYFKGNEIAQAQDWALAAVAQATKINMFGSLNLATNAELARDNVAEMVFNSITATVPVQYNELLGVYYNENQGIIYALNFNYLETLGYKNFDLVYRDDTQDIYGRPARTWGTGSYNTTTQQGTTGTRAERNLDAEGGLIASRVRMLDKDEIITVALTPDYIYTEGKDEDVVWKDLGRTLCTEKNGANDDRGYTWSAYVNGELVYEDRDVKDAYYGYKNVNYVPKNNVDTTYVMTGKGAQTEIYVDDGDATVTVVEINYYLGQVTRVSDNTITVKSLSTEPARLNIRTADAAGYDVDDLVVFTVDQNDDDDFYICETFEPETAEGTIKRVESDDDSHDSYVRFEVNGDKYKYSGAGHMVYDLDDLNNEFHPDLEEDYTLYMDPNGYVLAYELTSDGDLNYLYVKDSDEEMTDWVARVIYADATVAKVDVKKDLKDTKGNYPYDKVQWIQDSVDYDKDDLSTIDGLVWKYSKNSSGAHTLTWVDGEYLIDKDIDATGTSTIDVEIHNDRAYIGEGRGRVIVDQKTVFVDVKNEKSYTGYEAVPNVKNAEIIYVLDRKGVADVVFILDGKISDDGFYFVLEDTDRESWLRGGKGGDRYWEYTEAYVDGQKENVFVDYTNAGGTKDALKKGVLYKGTDVEEEDGVTYIEELEEVAIFNDVSKTEEYTENRVAAEDPKQVELQNSRVIATRRNGSFSLTGIDNSKELQYTSNADTVFVVVEETYKRDNKGDITPDGWNISKGNINDLDVIDYNEKLNTYVTVVQDDGNEVAEIVYILKTLTRYPVEITVGSTTKTYWAEMTKWNDATRTPVVSLDVYDADLVGVEISTQTATGATPNLTLNNGRLTGDITINENVKDNLEIKVTTTEPAPKPAEDEATVIVNGAANIASSSITLKEGSNAVKENTEFTITLKPGYEIEGKTAEADGSYKFTAPAAKETMTITITEKEAEPYTLTLTGDFAKSGGLVGNTAVFVNGKNVTATGVNEIVSAGVFKNTYTVKEGDKVIVTYTGEASPSDANIPHDLTTLGTLTMKSDDGETEMNVTTTSSSQANSITIDAIKGDLTLSLNASDGKLSDKTAEANQVMKITTMNGVIVELVDQDDTTKKYTVGKANGNDEQIIPKSATSYTATVKAIGDGKYVAVKDLDQNQGNAKAKDGSIASITADTTFYSGVLAKVATGITATSNTKETTKTVDADGTFVALGTVLTLTGNAEKQYIMYKDGANEVTTKTPVSNAKWTVSGKDDVVFDGAVKFTLGTGVKAEYTNTTKYTLDAGVWYMAENSIQKLTFEAVDKDNKAVVDPSLRRDGDMVIDNRVLTFQIKSDKPKDGDKWEAYTILKGTDIDDFWTSNNGINSDVFADLNEVGNRLAAGDVEDGNMTRTVVANTVYVKPGTTFLVCAKTHGVCEITATADGASVLTGNGKVTGTSSAPAMAEISVGDKKVEVGHTTIEP